MMRKWIISVSGLAVILLTCFYFINRMGQMELVGKGSGSSVKSIAIHLDKVVKPDFKQIFSSIEIVPLELNDSSIVGNIYRKKLYIPGKYYVIVDADHVIRVFDMDGKYISSSAKCIGKGPTEYYIYQDVSYNIEDDTFVVLDPFGNLTIYTSTFEFISKKKISFQTTDRPRELFILNRHLCILADSMERGRYYMDSSLVRNKELIHTMGEEDNPCIVKYKLK